jgi:hypothetical protein
MKSAIVFCQKSPHKKTLVSAGAKDHGKIGTKDHKQIEKMGLKKYGTGLTTSLTKI